MCSVVRIFASILCISVCLCLHSELSGDNDPTPPAQQACVGCYVFDITSCHSMFGSAAGSNEEPPPFLNCPGTCDYDCDDDSPTYGDLVCSNSSQHTQLAIPEVLWIENINTFEPAGANVEGYWVRSINPVQCGTRLICSGCQYNQNAGDYRCVFSLAYLNVPLYQVCTNENDEPARCTGP